MKSTLTTLMLFLSIIALQAQEFNPAIDKDSLFTVLIKDIPKERAKELGEMYSTGNVAEKDFILFMLYMPRSSKVALIANFEKNRDKIMQLRTEFTKLVPKDYTVYIEFAPADRIIQMPAAIDLHIYGPERREDDQEWDLQEGSDKLKERLKRIGWDENTLLTVRRLLDDAGCISIQNGRDAGVGFARSGMGKYSYRIFDNPLTKEK